MLERQRRLTTLAFLALWCAALALRLPLALRPGLWADEIFSLAMATGHSLEHPARDAVAALGDYVEPHGAVDPSVFRRYLEHDMPGLHTGRVVRAVLLSDTSPPVYYLLLDAWTTLAGTSDASLRLLSLLLALACLPLLWSIGREMSGPRSAWAACVLFTFSPVSLYYATEGRMYALVWLLALALAWTTLRLARVPRTAPDTLRSVTGSRPLLIALWVALGATGLLTHYFFAFIWSACAVWLALHPGALRRSTLVAMILLVGALTVPWFAHLPESLGRWRVTGHWLAGSLSTRRALGAPVLMAWSLLSGRSFWGGSVWADRVAAALYALVIIAVLLRKPLRLFSRRRQLLWLWLVAACIGPLAFDLLERSTTSTISRYGLPGFPAAMLLAGLGVSRLGERWRRGMLAALVLAWLPGTADIFTHSARPWEPFNEVAARLDEWARPGDVIIVHSIPSGVLGIARYLKTGAPIASWVTELAERRMPNDIEALVAGRSRVALVKIHDLNEPSPAEQWLREHATLERQDYWRWQGRSARRTTSYPEVLYFLMASHGRN